MSIGSAVSARLTIVTDRPTDRPRYSVRNNRPHLYVVVRCGLKTENLAGLVFLLVAGGSGALEPARGATTFSKLGGVQCLGLGYCTEQNTDVIPSFVHCSLQLRKKSWGGQSKFWGSRPPTADTPVVATLEPADVQLCP